MLPSFIRELRDNNKRKLEYSKCCLCLAVISESDEESQKYLKPCDGRWWTPDLVEHPAVFFFFSIYHSTTRLLMSQRNSHTLIDVELDVVDQGQHAYVASSAPTALATMTYQRADDARPGRTT